MRQGVEEQSTPRKPEKNTELAVKATAVINFQEFMLHCLKLYLDGKFGEVSLDDKQLLREFTRFKKHIDSDAFIRFQFDCRVFFDEFFIKSLDSGEGTHWEIRGIDPSDEDYNRVLHFRKVFQIQSMLNIGVALSLWLTDTLSHLLHDEKD